MKGINRGCLCIVALMLLLSACGRGDGNGLPSNFKSLSTGDKMEFLMANCSPDSVARFICNAAMGKVHNARIELKPAMVYAYEHYNEEDQVLFEQELDIYEMNLPLNEKVRFSKLRAVEDPDVFSYQLGLEFVNIIRENKMTPEEVEREIGLLKKECKFDPDFYKRFMTGFKTALSIDRGHDLDEKIYRKFINYPDTI